MPEIRELAGDSARGAIYLHSLVDLAEHGFEEQEVVIAGEATGAATPGDARSTRPYVTRLLVRRPTDRARFNGRVVVEWLNVTTGSDIEVLWCAARELILRDGYGWVGVTAQPLGVAAMQRWDPRRYAELEHPAMPPGELPPFIWGETYSDDIFTQVGALLRGTAGEALFGRVPDALLAHGQSQSSMRLHVYLRDTQPEADAFDGFILHAGGGTAISGRPPLPDSPPVPVELQRARVLKLNSEAEAAAYRPVQQTERENFVYWEVAGTGHSPTTYLRETLLRSDGSGFQRDRYEWVKPLGPATIEYAVRAAVHHLAAWVVDDVRPPPGVPIEIGPDGTIVRDEHGNACGGLRYPHVTVPVGRYFAANDDAHPLHPGFVPLPTDELAGLYPDQATYLRELDIAARASVADGFLLADDVGPLIDDLGAFDVATGTAEWAVVPSD